MIKEVGTISNSIKKYRQRKGLSQDELAQLIGVRRQAIYDMESGRYLPNTLVALRLARVLSCTVEMLFVEDTQVDSDNIYLLDNPEMATRLTLARVREKLVGVPFGATRAMSFNVAASDAFLLADRTIDCQIAQGQLDQTVLMLGCDPALSVLDALIKRKAPGIRIKAIFSSSKKAMLAVNDGNAHVAGIHYNSANALDGNIEAVKALPTGLKYMLVAFAEQEEGIMVAPGNPLGIRTVEDLTNDKVRFVNREEGAALRKLLDINLEKHGLPSSMLSGYENEVYSHSEGAMRVANGMSDAALGLRIVADSFGLSFVSLAVTRSDLLIPVDLLAHAGITVLLDVLQSAGIKKELGTLSGYDSGTTGKIILG